MRGGEGGEGVESGPGRSVSVRVQVSGWQTALELFEGVCAVCRCEAFMSVQHTTTSLVTPARASTRARQSVRGLPCECVAPFSSPLVYA